MDLSGSGTDSDPDTDEPSMSRVATSAGAGFGVVDRRVAPSGLKAGDFDDLDDLDLEEDEIFHRHDDDELLTKGNWSLVAHLKVQQLTDRIKRRLA